MAHHDSDPPEDITPVPPPDDAEDRAAILRRRAMFIASAIAGLGIASCAEPQPCLNVAIPEEPPADAGTNDTTASTGTGEAEPVPCLSVAVEEPRDAGADADDEQPEKPDAGRPKPGPCLKMAPPRPCLDMPPP